MILGGIQKNSFIDYPGKISCVLFFSGCNFQCPYCHNPDLATGCADCPAFLKDGGVFDFLEQRKDFLDGVVISGGEPTLQSDLAALCEKVKKMGYPVKLDTNGSRPRVLQGLIDDGLVDYIAMDIKTDPLLYDPLIKKEDCNPEDITSSIRLIMDSGVPYEFKTTCIKPLVNKQVVESICHYIRGARLYALQQCRNKEVLQPEFFQDDSCRFCDDELLGLQSAARDWVAECIVR